MQSSVRKHFCYLRHYGGISGEPLGHIATLHKFGVLTAMSVVPLKTNINLCFIKIQLVRGREHDHILLERTTG